MTSAAPRVLMIAQWPTIKNAEYELIERVKRTGFKLVVVDFLGFDIQTGKCVNDHRLCDEYDFAVSLHYETPKFLNIPTFHWIANPIEFTHGQGNYRTHLIHHLRSYDDYLYNGSEYLKGHVKSIVGAEWADGGLHFFQSCSRNALIEPRDSEGQSDSARKVFYCGINWEAISDKDGRAQGLLEILQDRQVADFYGPQMVLGVNVWGGFSSYRGEIPFDGESMFPAMHEYGAVLALSSPAHIKSRTSSGRVLEGFAAGVPVISDDNHHVRAQFGDLVHYFAGATEQERADAIQGSLDQIRTRPRIARERVREAQALISRKYCFEACLEEIRDAVEATRKKSRKSFAARLASSGKGVVVDVFLFHHDPYAPQPQSRASFGNIPYIARAMASLEAPGGGVRFRAHRGPPFASDAPVDKAKGQRLDWIDVDAEAVGAAEWDSLRLGEKVSRLARLSTGDFAVFFTQFDFPQHDYFTKALAWFEDRGAGSKRAIHVAGFFVNDLAAPAPMSSMGILRCNTSAGLYRWTQNSVAEHQLGQICFSRTALETMDFDRLERFDVMLPMATVLECMSKELPLYRSKHVLLRAQYGYYHRYFDAFQRSAGKGLWAKHYELLSNVTQEINTLYDVFHEFPDVVAIADKVLGIDLPPPPPAPPPPVPVPVDPAVYRVDRFLSRISPYVVGVKKIGWALGIGKPPPDLKL